jgi:hypothetical protein
MNKDQKREALEWLVNDTDPAKYVVIDFEGRRYKPPTLCGILKSGKYKPVTWRPDLKSFDIERLPSLDDLPKFLSNRKYSNGLTILAYSSYEEKVISGLGQKHNLKIRNVKPTIEYAWNRLNPGNPAKSNLDDLYFQICRKRIKDKGTIGERVSLMFDHLKDCHYDYAAMEPRHKQTWSDWLAYNRADCQAVVDMIGKLKRQIRIANISTI